MTNYKYKFCAPARINLIGEHIDYNGGVVLPAAVSLYIHLYANLRDDSNVIIKSKNFDNTIEASLSNLKYNSTFSWAIYVTGALYILKNKGYKLDNGLDLYFESDIPVGSGLSSSAAILIVTIYALNNIFNLNLDKEKIVLLAKEVENDYCSLQSGIMDEAIIALAKENSALLLDCAKFKYDYIDLNLNNYKFVILQTNKDRKLIESKYNERVYECNLGLRMLQKHFTIENLCELKESNIEQIRAIINDDIIFNRVKHVILENERVYKFAQALKDNDILTLGRLLNESHDSLKNLYSVTGFELDSIVSSALEANAIGARMTGAGFGGSAIALIDSNNFETFKEQTKKLYYEKTKLNCDIFLVDIASGVK